MGGKLHGSFAAEWHSGRVVQQPSGSDWVGAKHRPPGRLRALHAVFSPPFTRKPRCSCCTQLDDLPPRSNLAGTQAKHYSSVCARETQPSPGTRPFTSSRCREQQDPRWGQGPVRPAPEEAISGSDRKRRSAHQHGDTIPSGVVTSALLLPAAWCQEGKPWEKWLGCLAQK